MKFNTKQWTAPANALIATALGVFICYVSSRSLPMIRFLQYFPLTTLLVVEGPVWAVLSAAVSLVAMGFLLGVETGLVMGAQLVVIAFGVGLLLLRKKSLFHELVLPAVLFTALGIFLLFLDQRQGGNTLSFLQEIIQQATTEVLKTARESGDDGAKILQLEVMLRQMGVLLMDLIPSAIFLEGFIAAAITSFVSRLLLSHTEENVAPFRLGNYVITRRMSLLLLGMTAIGLVLASVSSRFQFLGSNLLAVAILLYGFHGLARIDARLRKVHVPVVLRILLYVASMILFFIGAVFILVGLIMSFFIVAVPLPQGGDHE